MAIEVGLNMEFVRRSEKPFAVGLEWAAQMGYKYVEPMRYTLKTVLRVAERYGIAIGIEPHNVLSRTTEGLLRIASLVEHPLLRICY